MIIGITASQFKSSSGPSLLLDSFPNAGLAYSLRHVNTDYTGDCITIKRASDSSTLNVGFDGEGVDEAAITSFCTGTSCYVTTWYDQSGNGYDLTTSATDCYIYTGGAIVTMGSKPAIQNTAGTNFLTSGTVPYTAIYSGSTSISSSGLVVYSTIAGKFSMGIAHSASAILQYIASTSSTAYWRLFNNVSLNASAGLPAAGTQAFIQMEMNAGSGTSTLWFNNSVADTGDAANSGSPSSGTITVGGGFSNTFYLAGKLQEIIIWPSYVNGQSDIYSNASTYWS